MRYLLAFLVVKAVLANLIGAPDQAHPWLAVAGLAAQAGCLYLMKLGKGYRLYMLEFSLVSAFFG